MAEFWEQQMMDRILDLYFHARKTNEQVMPTDQAQAIINYTKFLLEEQEIRLCQKIK